MLSPTAAGLLALLLLPCPAAVAAAVLLAGKPVAAAVPCITGVSGKVYIVAYFQSECPLEGVKNTLVLEVWPMAVGAV